MNGPEFDLERALHDPEYRREVIERLNREATETESEPAAPAFE